MGYFMDTSLITGSMTAALFSISLTMPVGDCRGTQYIEAIEKVINLFNSQAKYVNLRIDASSRGTHSYELPPGKRVVFQPVHSLETSENITG